MKKIITLSVLFCLALGLSAQDPRFTSKAAKDWAALVNDSLDNYSADILSTIDSTAAQRAAIILNNARLNTDSARIDDALTQLRDSLGRFNAKSYGATDGGVVEDQTAINTAITVGYNENTIKEYTVVIPSGEWYITAPVKLREGLNLEVEQGATFNFPDNYAGAMYTTDTTHISSPTRDSYIKRAKVSGGYYRGAGKICSWDLIDLRANDSDSSRQVYCTFENMYARDLNRGINVEITNDGWVHGNIFRNITLVNPKIAVRTRGGIVGTGFEDNVFDFLQVQWGDSSIIALDTLEQGRNNEFRHMKVYDKPADSTMAVLGADFDDNMFIGGSVTGSGINNTTWIDNGDRNVYLDTRVRRGEVRDDTISESDGINFLDYYDPFYTYPEHITLIYTGDDPVNIIANPQIGITSIPDGQIFTIVGTDDTNYVYLDHGTGLNLMGGIDCELGDGDKITFFYNAYVPVWDEIGRSDRGGLISARDIMLNGSMNFAVDVQEDDDYEVTIPQLKQLATGLEVKFIANTANTDGATLEISAVGSQNALLKMHDQPLATGDIEAGQAVVCMWDGSNWQITSQLAQ